MAYSPTWIVSIQVAGFGRIVGTICYLKELSTCHICIHLCIKYSRFQGSALPQKTSALSTSALPPDVRWLCPALATRLSLGYAPGPGLALRIYWAKGRTKGIAQKIRRASHGGAKPPPHIRRQSRTTNAGLLGQSQRFQGFKVSKHEALKRWQGLRFWVGLSCC